MTTPNTSLGGLFPGGVSTDVAAATAADALHQAAAARESVAQPPAAASDPAPLATPQAEPAEPAAPSSAAPDQPAVLASARRRTLQVGNYVGFSTVEAVDLVRAAGLRPVPDRQETPDEANHGIVLGQHPEPGENASRGEQVVLYVGAPVLKRAGGIPVHPTSDRAAAPPSMPAVPPAVSATPLVASPPGADVDIARDPEPKFEPAPHPAPDPPATGGAAAPGVVVDDADTQDDVAVGDVQPEADDGEPHVTPERRARHIVASGCTPGATAAAIPVAREQPQRRWRRPWGRHLAVGALITVIVACIAIGTVSGGGRSERATGSAAPVTVTVQAPAAAAQAQAAKDKRHRAAARQPARTTPQRRRQAHAQHRRETPTKAARKPKKTDPATRPAVAAPATVARSRSSAPAATSAPPRPAAADAAPAPTPSAPMPSTPRASSALAGAPAFENGQ